MPEVVCLADRGDPSFAAARRAVGVVCAGDSITGWNNVGPADHWPYRTYPTFLAGLVAPRWRGVANVGIAGEVSGNGVAQVGEALGLFPHARVVVVGYGTNDLGLWPEDPETSPRIVRNLEAIRQVVRDSGPRLVFLNVPPANGSRFHPYLADELRRLRADHNARLAAYAERVGVPVVDLSTALTDADFADELHPNDAGAEAIARAVSRVLETLPDDHDD